MSEKENKYIKQLTAKQERFCYEYCIDFNATQAAIRSGYSEDTARIIGAQNLSKLNIQNRIHELQTDLAKTSGISALRVIKEHEKIAFSSIAHLHNTWISRVDFENLNNDQKACIKSISTKIAKKNVGKSDYPDIIDVEFVKIELYDKQKSLDSINKMLGYESPIKTEVTGKDGKDLIPARVLTREEASQLLKDMDNDY